MPYSWRWQGQPRRRRKPPPFAFAIQAGAIDPAEIEQKPPTRQVIALEPDQPCYRLLIVDDKPDNRTLLVKLLGPLGFDLREAANGQEAVEIRTRWQPHLILMDLRMPLMGGYEATKSIREREWFDSAHHNRQPERSRRTIIIAFSASTFEEERATAIANGCDGFLRKPFRENDLFDLLHRHLGVRFRYAAEQPPPAAETPAVTAAALTPAALAALPAELRERLREAVELLEVATLNRLIDQIRPADPPLANALRPLVDAYRFDLIQEVFEQIASAETLPCNGA